MITHAPHITQVLDWMASTAPGAHLYSDSRHIAALGAGDAIFLAYPGDEADGRHYIAHAIAAGAKAVVHEAADFQWKKEWTVPHLAVTNLKFMAGPIAAAYYRHPDADMFTVAVTGTNGKTSCTQWLASALSSQDAPAAVIGTLGVGVCHGRACEEHAATGYTTPDAVLLQRTMAGLQSKGVRALAIEASSIGLDQGRLNGMHFDVALFTNFSRDHLDYHSDMQVYEAAKRILFEWPGLQHAVINMDDALGLRLVQDYGRRVPVIGYTLNADVPREVLTLCAKNIRTRVAGTEFLLESPFGTARVTTHLVGQFNVSNVLGVLGVLLAKGMAWDAAIEAVSKLTPVPGRMQQLGGKESPMVVIDYAHTPDALEKALSALRQVTKDREGKLWCVFGCGGDRDPGKRPQMGAVAEAADHVILTSDNPRSEAPEQIIQQILDGMKTPAQAIEDRAAAILQAVKQAQKRDVILVAGKGHERYQEVKGTKYAFADAEHVALALAARAAMKRGSE
ncbi:MAG: UDP-N-acetylmuramoyl-L-alanyl-D-glutamate--2,6-diaminopimelate ligase [Oxalobacter sp.]|nr:MAG: UDP-N-acetylmuramoyl-L-alanyl-D-glutamate--2,6-diaminopimelate ligase [Oxalobacter sp.]